MNSIIHIDQSKPVIAARNIRVHYPMPLHNPFKSTERITLAETLVAYEQWLRNRLIANDKLIVAEMERIASYVTDSTGKPVGLIGSAEEVEIIKRVIVEALNQ